MIELVNTQNLLTEVLSDLNSYVKYAKKLVDSGVLTQANVAVLELGDEKCKHQENL